MIKILFQLVDYVYFNFSIKNITDSKLVPESLFDSQSTIFQVFVQVMARCRTGDKPLPEQMMTQRSDAYICHPGSMS